MAVIIHPKSPVCARKAHVRSCSIPIPPMRTTRHESTGDKAYLIPDIEILDQGISSWAICTVKRYQRDKIGLLGLRVGHGGRGRLSCADNADKAELGGLECSDTVALAGVGRPCSYPDGLCRAVVGWKKSKRGKEREDEDKDFR